MPTNLYGPGDYYNPENSHVIPALISKFINAAKNNYKKVICWGSGSPYREFLYVDDLADACKFVLENWKPDKEEIKYLNVGTGKDIKIRQIAEIISKKCGFDGDIEWDLSKPDGTPKKQLDISKIRSLGWEPKTSFDEGLNITIQNYKYLKNKNELRK